MYILYPKAQDRHAHSQNPLNLNPLQTHRYTSCIGKSRIDTPSSWNHRISPYKPTNVHPVPKSAGQTRSLLEPAEYQPLTSPSMYILYPKAQDRHAPSWNPLNLITLQAHRCTSCIGKSRIDTPSSWNHRISLYKPTSTNPVPGKTSNYAATAT